MRMLNIPEYKKYARETKIAIIDNSTISFLEQIERAGVTARRPTEAVYPRDKDQTRYE